MQSTDPALHRRAQGTPAQDLNAEVDAVLKHLSKAPVVSANFIPQTTSSAGTAYDSGSPGFILGYHEMTILGRCEHEGSLHTN